MYRTPPLVSIFLCHILVIPTEKCLLFPYVQLTYLSFTRTRSILSDIGTEVFVCNVPYMNVNFRRVRKTATREC